MQEGPAQYSREDARLRPRPAPSCPPAIPDARHIIDAPRSAVPYRADVQLRVVEVPLGLLPSSPAGGRLEPLELGQRVALGEEGHLGGRHAELQRPVHDPPAAGGSGWEAAEPFAEAAEPRKREDSGGEREEGVVAGGRVRRVGAAGMEEPAAFHRRRRRWHNCSHR